MNRWPYPPRVVVLARRLGIGHSPLWRRVDRAESLVLLAAFLVAVAVLPFAVALGTAVYRHEAAAATAQAAQRDQVTAVLTQDAPLVATPAGTNATPMAPARWTDAHGTPHTAFAPAVVGEHAGDQVRIWTDAHGDLVNPPLSETQTWGRGFLAGLGLMLGVVVLLGGVLVFVHTRLDRVRDRTWAAEWRVFGPQWTTRAN